MLRTIIIILLAFTAGVVTNQYWHQQHVMLVENNVTTEAKQVIDAQPHNLDRLKVDPKVPSGIDKAAARPVFSLGYIQQLLAHHQTEEAIQLLRAELEANAAFADGWLLLVRANQELGNHREAVASWMRYLNTEMDLQKREAESLKLKHYLSDWTINLPDDVDTLWFAQQVDGLIALTADDPELHLVAANAYLAAEDIYQAQYHALMAANNTATKDRAEVILSQLNGDSVVNNEVTLPLARFGNQFIVTVTIDGTTARLLLDTGASISGVSSAFVAENPYIVKNTKPIRLNTANGSLDSYLFTVNQLMLGDIEFNQHMLAKLPLDSGAGFDGLMGVDLLGRFDFVIDQDEAVLRLGRRH